jgi:CDGSH-type Zn-finger protein
MPDATVLIIDNGSLKAFCDGTHTRIGFDGSPAAIEEAA